MTKTEAINLLDNLIGMVEDNQENDYDAALKMAVESLKTETHETHGVCLDSLIKRTDAIDAFAKWCVAHLLPNNTKVWKMAISEMLKDVPSEQPEDQWIIDALKEYLGESYKLITENEKEFKGWLELMRWHVLECDKLARELEQAKASVQPVNYGSTKEDDLINRQDVIDAINERIKQIGYDDNPNPLILSIRQAVREVPSAQPERDIPVKPTETRDRAWGIPTRQAVCPKCDYYLGNVAFLGDYKGKKITYCETCGQAIDWEGWDFDCE